MQAIIDYFASRDRFAALAGIDLVALAPGYARATLAIREHHLNALGTVHGAAIFTLADLVFAAAGNSHGISAVAVNVDGSFLKAVRGGTLSAEARELSRGPRLAAYRVEVTDGDGEVVAVFQSIAYRKKTPLPLAATG